MKKLSIAIVMVAASVSFVNAQSTDTAKKMETTAEQEMKTEVAVEAQSMKVDTVEAVIVEDTGVKAEAAVQVEPQTEAKKARKKGNSKMKKEEAL
ncbi:hypothetical protein [Chryseobacterium sp. MP_3.2]|uniref:hypothetical protein n=1 Tax=Chryseobacterium sp. MP_3.2 TaxID=3071712 RepID=UPI002DFBA6C0|nr:hypothetical protein [Chryseobacterium sp. MP_3.2]